MIGKMETNMTKNVDYLSLKKQEKLCYGKFKEPITESQKVFIIGLTEKDKSPMQQVEIEEIAGCSIDDMDKGDAQFFIKILTKETTLIPDCVCGKDARYRIVVTDYTGKKKLKPASLCEECAKNITFKL